MSGKTMKAVIKEEPKEGYILKDIPIPQPKADEVLFKVERVRTLLSGKYLYHINTLIKYQCYLKIDHLQ